MAEAAFLHKASMLGFGVSKPWGDSEPYDLIVDSGSSLWRVQVKSASRANKYGGYMFCAHGSRRKKSYSLKEIDVLVAYIVPEDLWYVLPVRLFSQRQKPEIVSEVRQSLEIQLVPRGVAVAGRKTLEAQRFSGGGEDGGEVGGLRQAALG